MEQAAVTVETLLAVCGGISIVGAAIAVIARWLSPVRKYMKGMKAMQEQQERDQENNEKRFKNDLEAIRGMQETEKLILRALIILLDHQVTGNGVDSLKTMKKEIETFLITK